MRLISLCAAALLAGCAAPVPQGISPMNADLSYKVPMDPGAIRCRDLSNPVASRAARDWAVGQARARALAGGPVVDAATVAASLADYCGANSGATVRDAATAA